MHIPGQHVGCIHRLAIFLALRIPASGPGYRGITAVTVGATQDDARIACIVCRSVALWQLRQPVDLASASA